MKLIFKTILFFMFGLYVSLIGFCMNSIIRISLSHKKNLTSPVLVFITKKYFNIRRSFCRMEKTIAEFIKMNK